jgi:dTDP-4-amino-4,6-dideoxygalactose transaminase
MTTVQAARAVPFFNYQDVFSRQEDEYVRIFRDVMRRGAFIMQQDLARFEAHFADYLGVGHAIGVGNATDGLTMAFRSAGLGPGDEVVFPSHTMVASAASIAVLGGVPVPVDCGADHLVDPGAIESAITPRTRFLMPVHLNGRTARMDAIEAIAARHDLIIIEDAAQGLGSRFKGRFAGTFGLAAAFSFYPAKILGCFGDGGAVVTNDAAVARHLRLQRDHGRNEAGDVELWGVNSRLDNLQAALLDFQFRDFGAVIQRRRDIAAQYQRLLGDVQQLILPPAPDADPEHFDTYQNYELEAEERDGLRELLQRHGVGTLVQWGGKAVHQFERLGMRATLPVTERLFTRSLMLPLNMTVSDDDIHYVCRLIREFYRCQGP